MASAAAIRPFSRLENDVTGINITFAIAAYNAAPFIEAAIGSVLAQTVSSVEIIVVDDESTDSTVDIVRRLMAQTDRLRLIQSTRNSGPAASRNKALSAARGTWLAVVDADDLVLPERSRHLLDLAQSTGADIVADNVDRFQEAVRRRILLENPSNYLQYRHSTIPECEFLGTVAQRTGCAILCDVNNIFVNAANHGWDAQAYLDALPSGDVKELHLAGHAVKSLSDGAVILIDDHGSQVDAAVWELFGKAVRRFGPLPTLIEWDTDIPPLQELLDQANRAAAILLQPLRDLAHADVA